ncbi:hypothetical protein GPECTOR_4g964 [Gonium pectorale]|uniref:Uncharacterized protein n=1 Tax=Gonium pectorale TaxID=33097 RepID=A0A150GYU8_GONPE|nr:hypothetical protein GPECTOR_4g964 [Gonium pectorale]|eukprot:KXZ54892.1 hypothetical protein GPECTOR_4g964 [Gonium pectorale]
MATPSLALDPCWRVGRVGNICVLGLVTAPAAPTEEAWDSSDLPPPPPYLPVHSGDRLAALGGVGSGLTRLSLLLTAPPQAPPQAREAGAANGAAATTAATERPTRLPAAGVKRPAALQLQLPVERRVADTWVRAAGRGTEAGEGGIGMEASVVVPVAVAEGLAALGEGVMEQQQQQQQPSAPVAPATPAQRYAPRPRISGGGSRKVAAAAGDAASADAALDAAAAADWRSPSSLAAPPLPPLSSPLPPAPSPTPSQKAGVSPASSGGAAQRAHVSPLLRSHHPLSSLPVLEHLTELYLADVKPPAATPSSAGGAGAARAASAATAAAATPACGGVPLWVLAERTPSLQQLSLGLRSLPSPEEMRPLQRLSELRSVRIQPPPAPPRAAWRSAAAAVGPAAAAPRGLTLQHALALGACSRLRHLSVETLGDPLSPWHPHQHHHPLPELGPLRSVAPGGGGWVVGGACGPSMAPASPERTSPTRPTCGSAANSPGRQGPMNPTTQLTDRGVGGGASAVVNGACGSGAAAAGAAAGGGLHGGGGGGIVSLEVRGAVQARFCAPVGLMFPHLRRLSLAKLPSLEATWRLLLSAPALEELEVRDPWPLREELRLAGECLAAAAAAVVPATPAQAGSPGGVSASALAGHSRRSKEQGSAATGYDAPCPTEPRGTRLAAAWAATGPATPTPNAPAPAAASGLPRLKRLHIGGLQDSFAMAAAVKAAARLWPAVHPLGGPAATAAPGSSGGGGATETPARVLSLGVAPQVLQPLIVEGRITIGAGAARTGRGAGPPVPSSRPALGPPLPSAGRGGRGGGGRRRCGSSHDDGPESASAGDGCDECGGGGADMRHRFATEVLSRAMAACGAERLELELEAGGGGAGGVGGWHDDGPPAAGGGTAANPNATSYPHRGGVVCGVCGECGGAAAAAGGCGGGGGADGGGGEEALLRVVVSSLPCMPFVRMLTLRGFRSMTGGGLAALVRALAGDDGGPGGGAGGSGSGSGARGGGGRGAAGGGVRRVEYVRCGCPRCGVCGGGEAALAAQRAVMDAAAECGLEVRFR